jgi:hypothetical protein
MVHSNVKVFYTPTSALTEQEVEEEFGVGKVI